MKNRIIYNIIFVIVSLIVCVFFTPMRFEAFDNYLNFILPIIGIINVIVFLSTSTKITNSWIGYDTLFLLGYVIVHFQIPFLKSIGIDPIMSDFVWINKQVVNYATWISLVAILFWMLGFWLSSLKNKNYINFKDEEPYMVNTKKIDILLLILSISFVALVGTDFLSGKYNGGDNWGAGAGYVYVLLQSVIILKLIYFFINYKYSQEGNILNSIVKNKIFISILTLYTFIFFISGDRGPVIEIIIVSGLLYSIFCKKIKLRTFLIGIVLGSFIMSLLSLGRSNDNVTENGILSEGYKNLSEKDENHIYTEELAMSNRILYRAIDVVPNTHPHLYGLTFASEIVGVIPFGGSLYLGLTDIPTIYKSSAYFFTILGQGEFFTFGEGTEVISDIFINFGFYGVLILMFSLGYFISYITLFFFKTQKHIYTVIYVMLVMGSLYLNRSHFLDPLKVIFYGLILDRIFVTKIRIRK